MTDRSKLPIYTHEYVLGADIGVRQRDDGPTDITATGERPFIYGFERRYIAEWARRVLFRVDNGRNTRSLGTGSSQSGGDVRD